MDSALRGALAIAINEQCDASFSDEGSLQRPTMLPANDGARLLKRETVERLVTNGLADAVLKQRGRGDTGWALANVTVRIDQASPLRGE